MLKLCVFLSPFRLGELAGPRTHVCSHIYLEMGISILVLSNDLKSLILTNTCFSGASHSSLFAAFNFTPLFELICFSLMCRSIVLLLFDWVFMATPGQRRFTLFYIVFHVREQLSMLCQSNGNSWSFEAGSSYCTPAVTD